MHLLNGSRIVIIGGGPAGSYTALHLVKLAAESYLELKITILEPREFNRPGPGSCNKCAGILSSTLIHRMESFGLILPDEVIQSVIDTYILHIGIKQLPLHTLDPMGKIISVYRGGGPHLGSQPLPLSFDGWLLQQAQERGVKVVKARAQSIRPGLFPTVVTAQGEFEADLVVMASGVNTRHILNGDWGYQPPRTEKMAQDEILLPDDMSEKSVHIFFENPEGLIFGAIIPKGRYANISLLGHGLPADAVKQFLEAQGQNAPIPNDASLLCGCTPNVTVSIARDYFMDRLVVVGDAAVTRLYKDGIGSSFITAEAVARTAIHRGVSRQDFATGYQPVCKRIAVDNDYGRLLFRIWSLIFHTPFLRKAWIRLVMNEVNQIIDPAVHVRVLWGMFTGDESYRALFWTALSLPAMRNLLRSTLSVKIR